MSDVTIRKRYRKNSVVYEYRFEIATVDGKRKWKTNCGYRTVQEAQREGKNALLQYENCGQVIEKDEISYSDYLDSWIINDCMIDLKPVTVEHYKRKIDSLLKPELGKYRVKSLTREILQAFLIKMFDKGYSYNSLTVIKGLLTKSLNYAEDNHYISHSPAVRLKIPKHRIPKTPTRTAPHIFIPSDIMAKIFARFPEQTSSFIPLKLGYECGLRLGETFGLCWEDIDFINKVIRINRQMQWLPDNDRTDEDKISKNGSADSGSGCWYFSAPKYNSYRIIELSDKLIEILFREKERQEKAKDYYGSYYTRYYAEKSLCFDGIAPQGHISINRIETKGEGIPIHLISTRENGTFISPRTMQHVSRIIRKNIFNGYDYHSLRHTHASLLNEMGVAQKYIQTRLGHSKINMTINVYEHVTDNLRTAGRKAINCLFS